MANEYRYGQKGVSTDLQFGKRGPRVVANATTSALQVTAADGTTLSNLRIANAVIDALSHLGIENMDIPITPYKIWKALKDKKVAA